VPVPIIEGPFARVLLTSKQNKKKKPEKKKKTKQQKTKKKKPTPARGFPSDAESSFFYYRASAFCFLISRGASAIRRRRCAAVEI
jgi:hypothetical protein